MADGYPRFQAGGAYPYQNHTQQSRHLAHRNGSPISGARGLFQPNLDAASPNRSPGTRSPAHNLYANNMFGTSNNHRHNQLLSGGSAQIYQNAMGFNSKSYQAQHHGSQVHHVNGQGLDHGGAGYASHNYTNSGSTLNASTPHYAPAHLSNGTPDQSHASISPPNEHWAEQEAEYHRLKNANDKPHYYARNSPHVSRFPGASQSSVSQQLDPGEHGDRRKAPAFSDEPDETGCWDAMDLGGHGLRSMNSSIFRHYPDLSKIYFNHNALTWLPPDIGLMRSLTILDLSFNQLESLPAEIGMLTNLKKLLVYGNKLRDLPTEIGTLFQLETLGVAGNSLLRIDYIQHIRDNGTKDFVRHLREQAERLYIDDTPHRLELTVFQHLHHRMIESGLSLSMRLILKLTSSVSAAGTYSAIVPPQRKPTATLPLRRLRGIIDAVLSWTRSRTEMPTFLHCKKSMSRITTSTSGQI